MKARTARRWGTGFLMLLFALAGCALPIAERVRQDLATGRSRGRYIEGVPFVAQREYYCGPASLAMVLAYWARRPTRTRSDASCTSRRSEAR